jgi:hypothetical protein
MLEIREILTSPSYWFVTVFSGVVIGLVVNLITPWIAKHASDHWLSAAVIVNAVIFSAIGVSYGTFMDGEWPVNWLAAFFFGGIYFMSAFYPSRALHLFAFLAPNLTCAALVAAYSFYAGIEDAWAGVVSLYPFSFILYANVVLIWTGVVLSRMPDKRRQS